MIVKNPLIILNVINLNNLKTYFHFTFILSIATAIVLIVLGFKNIKQDDKTITLQEYNKKIANKEKLILVYFSADWCAVCLKMKPILEELRLKDSLKIEILNIDTDRDKELTMEFEIDALPVLMLYKKGCREWVNIGLIGKSELNYTVSSYMKIK